MRPQPHVMAILLLMAVGLSAPPVIAQVDQSELAQRVLDDRNVADRAHALETVREFRPTDIGPELGQALFAALARENMVRQDRWAAGRRGESVPPLPDPEFYLDLVEVGAEMEDHAAIPVLAGALGSGMPAVRALARFGEASAAAVLNVVMSQESPRSRPAQVQSALRSLTLMVIGPANNPLKPATLERIRRAAEFRLTGDQEPATLLAAIDLAIALDNPELRGIVHSFATDRTEVMNRGIREPGLIDHLQSTATDRLANGVPVPDWWQR